MSKEMIIKLWRMGLTVQQIASEYMIKYNKKLKEKDNKINKKQAQSYVEPIIFDYQVNILRGVDLKK